VRLVHEKLYQELFDGCTVFPSVGSCVPDSLAHRGPGRTQIPGRASCARSPDPTGAVLGRTELERVDDVIVLPIAQRIQVRAVRTVVMPVIDAHDAPNAGAGAIADFPEQTYQARGRLEAGISESAG
jgi:hypothetical protein